MKIPTNEQLGIMPSPPTPRDYDAIARRVGTFGFSIDIFRQYDIRMDSYDVALALTLSGKVRFVVVHRFQSSKPQQITERQLARALRQFAYKVQKEGAK